jgi:hypothetical protein
MRQRQLGHWKLELEAGTLEQKSEVSKKSQRGKEGEIPTTRK